MPHVDNGKALNKSVFCSKGINGNKFHKMLNKFPKSRIKFVPLFVKLDPFITIYAVQRFIELDSLVYIVSPFAES